MKFVPLSAGKRAKVDDEDFERVSQFKWSYCPNRSGYAVRTKTISKGKYTTEPMARFIMNAPRDLVVDHINGNTLDNRRSNLRLCTRSQNQLNMKVRSDNKSGFRGVTWSTQRGKWHAQIWLKGHLYHLGFFSDKVEAARAYNARATELFGEFARLNVS